MPTTQGTKVFSIQPAPAGLYKRYRDEQGVYEDKVLFIVFSDEVPDAEGKTLGLDMQCITTADLDSGHFMFDAEPDNFIGIYDRPLVDGQKGISDQHGF